MMISRVPRDREPQVAMVSEPTPGLVHRIVANGIADKPITLDSDDKLNDDDSNLHAKHMSRILNSGRPGNDAFSLINSPTLPNHVANEHDDGDISIDNTKSPRPAKRQRSASPSCNSILLHAGMSPLSYNVGWNSGREITDNGDCIDSKDDDVYSKRRRLSDVPGVRTALKCCNKRLRRPLSPISEQGADDGPVSISADGGPTNTARTAPALESAPPRGPQLCPQVIDADKDRKVRQIIGKEDVDGVLHYWVDWHSTLLPEHSLGHAKEIVDKFEARLRSRCEVKKGRGRPILKRGGRAVVEADIPGDQQKRKPRGRPRKRM